MSDDEDPRGTAGGCLSWVLGAIVAASVVLFLVFSLRGHR